MIHVYAEAFLRGKNSQSAGEMWNRHIKVPKILPGLSILVNDMN